MKFPFYKQLDIMDCGATSLRIVAKQHGKDYSINHLRRICDTGKQGVSLHAISNAAEQIGFNTLGIKVKFKDMEEASLPCILHWKNSHFVVLFRIYKKRNPNQSKYVIADPSTDGILKIDASTFQSNWSGGSEDEGIALLLEPTPKFYKNEEEFIDEEENFKRVTWLKLWGYMAQHKAYFFQIIIGLLAASLFQLLIPFLTQGIVDKGVNMQDMKFVYIALIAQFVLLVARTVVEFSRQGLLLYISTHVNLTLLTDFWKKLMRLPISYFDSKQAGDIMQRIGDQHMLERFITGNSINILFSMVNLLVYSFVMLLYSIPVFLIFFVGSTLYLLWVALFLKQRRKLNYRQFALASLENSATMELVYGMQEIKQHNAEKQFRWNWERMQRGLFGISFQNLTLSQMQQAGAVFINEGKDLLITGIVALAVIKGELTLGAMLAIQYILGALNSPVQQFTGFIQDFQDAKISLERLNEIHRENDEPQREIQNENNSTKPQIGVEIRNLSFGYLSGEDERVLKNINLKIEEGKLTAIVGMSGSGKTTLLKILQKYYDDKYKGEVKVYFTKDEEKRSIELKSIIPAIWRDKIGSVMQDGYVFSQSIGENIAVGIDDVDKLQLRYAARMANIDSFIDELPLKFDTKIGTSGNGISMGQRQRVLIARAVYKNPELILFDEATNSLDANNEKVILENLVEFFKGKTVVVVAHRLSTVKNADKIVVLHQGEIVEEGTHVQLIARKGKYFELVKNQLELGN